MADSVGNADTQESIKAALDTGTIRLSPDLLQQIAKEMKVSESTIERLVEKLKDEGRRKILLEGDDRGKD